MAGEIIRQGDPTSHGGTVLEGSITDICMGKPISYIGHKVSCPLCKGIFAIIEGVPTTTLFGRGVAVAGMRTACGAVLLATQFTDTVEWSTGAAPMRASGANIGNATAGALGRSTVAGEIAKFDEQIQLVDGAGVPLCNTWYKIVTSAGATFEGMTDAEGKTRRVATNGVGTLNIYMKG